VKRSTVIAGLAALVTPLPARAQQLIEVKLALPPGTAVTPALYAQKAGLFRAAGLSVDLQKMNSGAAIVAAVVGGSVQIGSGNVFSIVTAHAHSVPVQIIAGSAVYSADEPVPYGMLLVKTDGPIKTAADLNGKTLALTIARGDLSAVSTQAWFDQHGGDWSSVHVLELPQDAMVAALDQGRIDAMTMYSPNCTMAMATGKVRLLGRPYDAVARRFSIAAWFAQNDWASRNTDIVRRFGQAMAEASTYANSHPREVMPLLAGFSGIDLAVLEHAARAPFVARAAVTDLQPIVDIEVKYKVIEKRFDAADLIGPNALN
jgi:NitT/TauT family transport system substrate-binding protein